MPEPFKTIFNPDLIAAMGQVFSRVHAGFDADRFQSRACDGLEALEMLARAEQISQAIDAELPEEFSQKCDILVAALHPERDQELSEMAVDAQGIAGWAVEPLGRIIARHGLESPELSLATLREMTMRFSSEFAVRPFFRDHPELTLATAHDWAEDENNHVRRLASEGARPVLPWGIKLQHFVKDPTPLIPLLRKLRDDPSDYVRRSVANNLNDISKSHPDLVAEIAADWSGQGGTPRARLLKHACRGLIKAGHPKTLAAFGFGPPALTAHHLHIPDRVCLGDDMEIIFEAQAERDQNLLIDYVLHFMRANGRLSAKTFKWAERSVKAGETLNLHKIHKYKKVTTRKDYPGRQRLDVQVNGVIVASGEFEFTL